MVARRRRRRGPAATRASAASAGRTCRRRPSFHQGGRALTFLGRRVPVASRPKELQSFPLISSSSSRNELIRTSEQKRSPSSRRGFSKNQTMMNGWHPRSVPAPRGAADVYLLGSYAASNLVGDGLGCPRRGTASCATPRSSFSGGHLRHEGFHWLLARRRRSVAFDKRLRPTATSSSDDVPQRGRLG